MGMITKTVTGDADALKYVDNAKNAPLDAKGGTKFASFTGAAAPRAGAGAPNNAKNKYGMVTSPGYVDQAPVEMDVSGARTQPADSLVPGTGPTATTIKKKYNADNNASIEKGMGGTVCGPLTSKFGDM